MALSPGEQYSGGNVVDASQRLVVAIDNSSTFNSNSTMPGVVSTPGFSPTNFSAAGVTVALTPRGIRVICPKAGVLHDLAFMPAVASGNCSTAIYDTGDAAGSGTRTLLYSSGSMVVGTANIWQSSDPSLTVTAGQQLDFWLMADNTTASFYRFPSTPTANLLTLPASFDPVPGGAAAKMSFTQAIRASLTDWPATIAEANVTSTVAATALIARVV